MHIRYQILWHAQNSAVVFPFFSFFLPLKPQGEESRLLDTAGWVKVPRPRQAKHWLCHHTDTKAFKKPQPSGSVAPAFLIKSTHSMYAEFTHNTHKHRETPWGGRPVAMSTKLWFTGPEEGLRGQPESGPGKNHLALPGSHLIMLL